MQIYQKILAVVVLFGLGAIFWAGTCLFEEIFRKKYHDKKLGERVIDKLLFLFLGIIFMAALPFLIIDFSYNKFNAEIYWIFSRERFLLYYCVISLLLWGLSFLIGKRKGKNFIK